MLLIARSFGCRDADSVIAGRSWAIRTNDSNLQSWATSMILGKLSSLFVSPRNDYIFRILRSPNKGRKEP